MAIKIDALPQLPPEGQTIRQAFPEWRMAIHNHLSVLPAPFTRSPHGLLVHILSEEEYLRLDGVTAPAPLLRLPRLASAKLIKKYEREVQAVNAFKLAFVTALSRDARSFVCVPGGQSIHEMSLRVMMAKIEAKFGRMSHHDRKAMHEKLLLAYNPPYSMLIFELDHREVHRRLQADGQPLSDFDKFNYYCDSLKPCGLFTEAIRNYLRNYPSPDFDSFSVAMSAEADLCGSNTTVATAGYGTALVTANRLPSSSLHFKSMEELTTLITSTVTQVLEQRQRDETKRRRQRKQRDKQKTAA